MPQNQLTGEAGRNFGKIMAKRVAAKLDTSLIGNVSNECIIDGELAVIKSAASDTTSVIVTDLMLKRLSWVIAAFRWKDGNISIFKMSAVTFRRFVAASKSKSHKLKQRAWRVSRKNIIRNSEEIARIYSEGPTRITAPPSK